jgi:hypothetical protein
MHARQLLVLYVVALALGIAFWRIGPPRPAPEPGDRAKRPRVLSLDPRTVSELRVDHGARHVVARRDGDGWQLTEPGDTAVPGELVKAFVGALVEAEEIERVPAGRDLAAFGLDDEATRIQLYPSGGPPETLLLGATNPSGTAVYARHLGDPDILLVGRTIRYYEELIFQALPAPTIPADTPTGPVAHGAGGDLAVEAP